MKNLRMDLSPSPFWIKNKQQTLVFDFSNFSAEDNADDGTSEVLIGNNYSSI